MYQSFAFPGFGLGLNLRDKADAVQEAEAIDCLNVTFTERGTVQQRAGYSAFCDSALTNRIGSLHPYYTTSGTRQLLAGCGTRLEGLSTAGAVVDSETGLTTGTWDFARTGTPNAERVYAGQGTDTLRKWDGSTWTAPTATVDGTGSRAMPKAGALAVMPVSNRLVATRFATTTGGPHAATSSPSHVYFSEEGDPETWLTTNFIQLVPGDGEAIQAVIAWREYIFVFKETKFFVFYGESIDAVGEVIFDYRVVDTGIGLAAPKAITANEKGIYFLAEAGRGHGIYMTNGGEPLEVSNLVQPIFAGGASPYYLGGSFNHSLLSDAAMGALDDRIYLAFSVSGTANNRVLVYDTNYEWWSLWDFPATCFADFEVSDHADLMFGYAAGTNDIGRHRSAETNDDGVAISSRWRSGWFDHGSPDQKTVRESKVWGSGEPFMGIATDFQVAGAALTQLLLPVPPASGNYWNVQTWNTETWVGERGVGTLAPLLRRVSARGTVFSTLFQNAILDQSWAIHRLSHHVRELRPPSKLKGVAAA